jgi:protein-tyrosine phosphatase
LCYHIDIIGKIRLREFREMITNPDGSLVLMPELTIIQIGDYGKLYLSADRDDWSIVIEHQIAVLIDLDGDLDCGVPSNPDEIIYIYFPIYDEGLPNLARLHAIARLAADLCRQGESILTHCKLGLNRSGLLVGLILTYLGLSGESAVTLLRERRPGALYNEIFADYLLTLPAQSAVGDSRQ